MKNNEIIGLFDNFDYDSIIKEDKKPIINNNILSNELNIEDELTEDFIVYANEVNNNRAFPDARDGLKVVNRAILWDMYLNKYFSNKPHVKCAKISGSVIGHLHPHGDTAVYEALVRMSQDWIYHKNIAPIDFHGANGSLIGGPDAASSRYTEARLSRFSEDNFFKAIDKDVVNKILNFSEDEKWPEVLPSTVPMLLLSQISGIGYTIANDWLPHNLLEIYGKVKEYIETNNISYDNIYPDFPTGGIIINKSDIKKIYETGKGSVILRGKATVDKQCINITELPYQVYAEPFIQKLKDLVNTEQITGIEDICNKSDDNGLNIEIECSDNPQVVLTKLYKLTDLQINLSANQMALVKGIPTLLNLKDYLKVYVDHNIECIIREYTFDLNKATNRLEIVDGLIRAISIIDDIIILIKSSTNSNIAKENLMTKFNFTENQAKAIVDMKLGKLANLEIIELNKEQQELNKTIKNCEKMISSKKTQQKEFLNRLEYFVDKYKWDRKTEVIDLDINEEKSLLKSYQEKSIEEYVIALTKGNTLKRMTLSEANKKQKVLSESDIITHNIKVGLKDRFVLISASGQMYKLPANKIDICNINSTGMNVSNLLDNEKIVGIYTENEEIPYLIFVTKKGLIKKIKTETVIKLNKLVGAPVMNVNEDDEIIYCELKTDDDSIILNNSKKDKEIKIKDLLDKGRSAGGIVGINLTKNNLCIVKE